MGALELLSSSLLLPAGTGPRPFLGGLDSLLVLGELEPLHSLQLLRGEVTPPDRDPQERGAPEGAPMVVTVLSWLASLLTVWALLRPMATG